MGEIIGYLKANATHDLPLWSLNNFFQNTSSNYLKLVTLREICSRFSEGARDRDFVIGVNSFELFPALEEGPHYIQQELGEDIEPKIVYLTSKEESASRFWELFRNLHRPIVSFRTSRGLEPIYNTVSEQALQLKSLTSNSPVTFSFQGTINALIDLFRGRINAQRDNEHITQAIANIRNIVETSHLIENQSTPPGVKKYAYEQLKAIMNKQNNVNEKLGIKNIKIWHD